YRLLNAALMPVYRKSVLRIRQHLLPQTLRNVEAQKPHTVELEGDNVLTQRERERNTKEHLERTATQISVEVRPGRGAGALSLLLSNHEGQTERSLDPFLALGWFISAQPGTGTTGGLQLSHQAEEPSSCSYAPNSQPIPDRAKVTTSPSGIMWGKLNALQNSLKTDRLVILGFPCNQFGKQEPGQNSEILQGIKHVRPGGGYVPNFQLFQKGDVNGENEQKIYTFLKNSCPPVVETFGDTAKLFWSPLKIHDIKWNFEKFLVNPQGKPVMRWFHRPMFPLHVRPGGGYVPNFQLFQKGDVNGENEQKIYTFLKNSCPPVVETFGDTAKLFWSPLKIHDIKWNFEKFLVNPQGKPVMRWFHRTNVSTVKNDIIRYMRKNRNG
ncbi:hypothetical protein E2320_015359, partial [Naja naja]